MSSNALSVFPIGYVRVIDAGCCLAIEPEYRQALRGLEGFSHINVIWWCHGCDDAAARTVLECEQPYKQSPAKLGIFATRSPLRPNPIAITAVMALKLDVARGLIVIPYIDAEDGTPILDIKPYHPSVDRIRDVSVPAWCRHWPQWYEDSADFDWGAEFVNAH